MDPNELNRLFDQMSPTPEQEEAILARLRASKQEGTRPMKKLLATLTAAALAFSLAACSNPGSTASESSSAPAESGSGSTSEAADATPEAEPITMNVAYLPNYASLVEVVTADRMGYFEEEGIDVNLVQFQDGPTIIAAMENGSIDVGYIGSGAHKLCINGQAKIFCFAHVGNGDRVMALKSHGIETAADLAGKTVGYASGTSSEAILQKTLASAGLTIDDINAMEMEPSGIVNAMVSGSLDACALWSPSTLAVQEELGDDVIELADNLSFSDSSASVSSWICMADYADENYDNLLRFTRALYKAKDYRADEANAEQISQWIAEECALDFDTVYSQRGDAEWLTSDEMMAEINDGTIEALYKSQQDGFIASGDVESEVPVSDYVMFDLMKEAAE